MSSNILHSILALIFFIFGIIQYNDPDFWLWGPIYFLVATIPILYLKEKLNPGILLVIITAYALFIISYVPDFIAWIKGGMPNIAAGMKAEEIHIELTREFLGLVICMVALVWYYLLAKKDSHQEKKQKHNKP